MRNDKGLDAYASAFDSFISEYGHRSHTREIFFPRWKDDPTLVVDVIRSLVGSSRLDLEELERRKIAERLEAERDILGRVSRLRWGFGKKVIFKTVLKYAQIYLVFRENQRFYLDHQILRQRRLFMEYGRRLHERGLLSDPTDVFFLSKEEVFDAAGGGAQRRDARDGQLRLGLAPVRRAGRPHSALARHARACKLPLEAFVDDPFVGGMHVHQAANLPNRGQIPNLPLGATVETPVVVNGAGIQPVVGEALPEGVAELCRREITAVQLCVDAAIYGDRQKALQCLLLDPVIQDIDQARQILDAYLEAYRAHLPQFWQ